ncbi:FAD-binding oxidoreductase [Amycolatopsis sp. NPDC059657]|uniref:FAD-binding oxidoreductase n=1 Tax=Amycolatopsis sp. NPDC059657 TaxID=3346899 RepID=UPI00366FD2B7
MIHCRSVSDVVAAMTRGVVPRGGGHCFAGRSSSGVVLDMSGLDRISVTGRPQIATIGAGARLGQVYAALHTYGRTIPAGCGDTVGIAGLTLGGGIGLLGRQHGLTCDRLVGAQVVLADRRVVECDRDREPDLFWALRGAGGCQFGVVTELRFDTVPEPMTTRIEARLAGIPFGELVSAWQAWAPDAPDGLTVNLTLEPAQAVLFGASTLDEATTRSLLREFIGHAGVELRAGLPYHRLKSSFADPRDLPVRIRSEFFSQSLSERTISSLLTDLEGRLAFTAMGGAYNRVAECATAFAHRGERFLLEHVAEPGDPWVDRSWATAHADGSGRVYPNFPDLALDDSASAYHAGNHARLVAIKQAYDPHRFFDFPQAI